jgi:hypothetical protein
MSVAVVVLAKAPVAGMVKTRLAHTVGDERAADLAATALLDTIEVCADVFPSALRVAALAGDLRSASRAPELVRMLRGWQVIAQGAGTLGERIVQAVHDTHRLTGGPVVLVGMDTPHAQAPVLAEVARRVEITGTPVLGPSADGGWWVLAVADPRHVDGVAQVMMSRPETFAHTRKALCRTGFPPDAAPMMRDVDTAADAACVAAAASQTRFARAWREGQGRNASQPRELGAAP